MTQLLTTDEQGFEAGVGGWTSTGVTFGRMAATPRTGSYSFGKATGMPQNTAYVQRITKAVTPNYVVTASGYRYQQNGQAVYPTSRLVFLDGVGATLGTVTGTASSGGVSSYGVIPTVTAVAPSNAASVRWEIFGTSNAVMTDVGVFFDDLSLDASPFVDGQQLTTDEQGFEAGYGAWVASGYNYNNIYQWSVFHTGTKSILASQNGTTGATGLGTTSITKPCPSGKVVSASIWENGTNGINYQLRLVCLDISGSTLATFITPYTHSSGFMQWAVTGVTPAGTVKVRLEVATVSGTNPGAPYIDDCSLIAQDVRYGVVIG